MRLFGNYPLTKLVETLQGLFGLELRHDNEGNLTVANLYLFHIKIVIIPNKSVSFCLLKSKNGSETWVELVKLVAK